MSRIVFFLLFFSSITNAQDAADSLFIRKIFDEALTNGQCYEVLRHLCKDIGPRLSGSAGAARAVTYMKEVLEKDGFDKVFLQDVMVPHWERGKTYPAKMNSEKTVIQMNVCALGGSVGTGKGGIEAKVLEVQSVNQLDSLGKDKIAGKIVFFARPMQPRHIHTFEAYGGCVDQRWAGPAKAAKYGALATVVRSVSLTEDEFPHTGSMSYDSAGTKIPAFALSTIAATQLSAELKRNPDLTLSLLSECRLLPDTMSHNVIAQINGRNPDNFMLSGGHLDAWDNGEGAHDDGAGCVQSMEALRILKKLGYTPNNSIRAVLFMNEENGLRGGKKYAELAKSNNEKHIAAIESDRGGFTPRGFYIDDSASVNKIKRYKTLLEPYGLHDFKKGGGGADIGPLKKEGTLCIGYIPDSQRYFDYHHASSDTFDKVNKRELELGAASIAALLYLMDKYGLE